MGIESAAFMAKYMFLAPGLPLPFSPLSPEAFEEIKHGSGKAWKRQALQNEDCSTTYSGAYGNKEVDTATRYQVRVPPTSPTRMHRPHPPDVFLVNQLHHLPGHYGNAKQRVATDNGFHPRSAFASNAKAAGDLRGCQVHPLKINHNAVIVASPVTPLDAIQQLIKQDNLDALVIGNRIGQEIEVSTPSVSKDIVVIPTGITSTSSDKQLMWDSEATSPDSSAEP